MFFHHDKSNPHPPHPHPILYKVSLRRAVARGWRRQQWHEEPHKQTLVTLDGGCIVTTLKSDQGHSHWRISALL